MPQLKEIIMADEPSAARKGVRRSRAGPGKGAPRLALGAELL